VVIEGVTVLPMSCHFCVTHVLSPCRAAVLPISPASWNSCIPTTP
jgi:hypothetical protein